MRPSRTITAASATGGPPLPSTSCPLEMSVVPVASFMGEVRYELGERRGVSPTWLGTYTSGLRLDARRLHQLPPLAVLAADERVGLGAVAGLHRRGVPLQLLAG